MLIFDRKEESKLSKKRLKILTMANDARKLVDDFQTICIELDERIKRMEKPVSRGVGIEIYKELCDFFFLCATINEFHSESRSLIVKDVVKNLYEKLKNEGIDVPYCECRMGCPYECSECDKVYPSRFLEAMEEIKKIQATKEI